LQKNARSANVCSTRRVASRSAGSLVNQFDTCQILRACSSSAFIIAGWPWPSEVTATPLAKSMYRRPCWSHTRDPSPRTGRKGAGAKHGTITSSNVARVTGIVAGSWRTAGARADAVLAGVCADEAFDAAADASESGGMKGLGGGRQAAATSWISTR
jgi:hypothetical protein